MRITNQNPYNFIGIVHNGALDTIASIPGFENLSASQRCSIVGNYNNNHGEFCNVLYSNIEASVNEAFDSSFDIASPLITKGLDPQIASKIQSLFELIGYRANMDYSQLKSVDDVTDSIEQWEADVISTYGSATVSLNSGLDLTTDSGRAAYLLGTAAVMKYSYAYWFDDLDNSANPWHTHFDGPSTGDFFLSRFWDAIRNAKNDACAWVKNIHVSILKEGQPDVVSVNLGEARAAAQVASSD